MQRAWRESIWGNRARHGSAGGSPPALLGGWAGLLRNLLQQLICLLYQRRRLRPVDAFAIERGVLQDLNHLAGEGIPLSVEVGEIVFHLVVSRVTRIIRDQR